MSNNSNIRVMWLLNHTTARKFEVKMLKSIGIKQIFLPKIFPQEPSFRTASVDYSEDEYLDIPIHDLEIINNTDWYSTVPKHIWDIANKYFNVVFFLPMTGGALENISKYYNGIAIWRVYGRDKSANYDTILNDYIARNGSGGVYIRNMGKRFYFGEAYSHIADNEPLYLKKRRLYLPLGLANTTVNDKWEGTENVIYFVCPEIAISSIYKKIYDEFKIVFSGLPYIVAGAQPIPVNDKNVLGYVSDESHIYNMRQSKVMFYHSQEPNHIHYHPFEAIRAGMPLVFMAGGMLDRIGGKELPGRCLSTKEARLKVQRILNNDMELISRIKETQNVLLEVMDPKNCVDFWRINFQKILHEADLRLEETKKRPNVNKRTKIAVVIPNSPTQLNIREALSTCIALKKGSRQSEQNTEIVLLHLENCGEWINQVLDSIPDGISIRSFKWKFISSVEARRAMRYAGFKGWEPQYNSYLVVDDEIQQLQDCDLWLFLNQNLSCPILPLKKIVLKIDDFSSRYYINDNQNNLFNISIQRLADKILVTTNFAKQHVMQYIGVDYHKVIKLPMLPSVFFEKERFTSSNDDINPYFIWITDNKVNNNHINSVEALRLYYEELDGQLECRVLGLETESHYISKLMQYFLDKNHPLQKKQIRKKIILLGEITNLNYEYYLSNSVFNWHTVSVGDAPLSVLDAAKMGRKTLSSKYPTIVEINDFFSLELKWMNQDKPMEMAEMLKKMELEMLELNSSQTYNLELNGKGLDYYANVYWKEIYSCL